MSSDRTQHQSSEEQEKARELSIESTRPPAQIPGYKLQRFVGRGTYGEVWSATDLKTGRRVAIKFYLRGSRTDVQSLAQEVEKLVVLSADRYVVQLLDVGWDADPPFYVMEYIEQGSLEDRLKNGKTLPASEAVELFQEIATGMMHLHGKGILHCDLKPGNVLLDQDGKPRVADFGQSRLKTDKTSALGTLFYMAPEQADTTAAPDARWDVYAMGALLYSMLTGKPPYYSRNLAKRIESTEEIDKRLAAYRNALMNAPLPTEHRQVPGIDRMLADTIDKCIAADPKKRFNNIQSVILALRERELVKSRRPLMLLGGLGPFLLILVTSLFGWWAFNQAISTTGDAVTAKARDSNKFAAQLAARSAAEQINEYFRIVTQLARDTSFQDKFDEFIADDEVRKLRQRLADPAMNARDGIELDEGVGELRTSFNENESRINGLQAIVESRLKDAENIYPPAASWFICDRYGNQIASAFPDENITLGNNFCYRTYFTGEESDLELDDPLIQSAKVEDIVNRPIIDKPHLSAVFLSKQSKHWKVAFSAPVIRYGKVEGIVAVTVDLGDFVEFQDSNTQYAMLVDGRAGEFTGAILEHPLFTRVLDVTEKIPDELANTSVDLDAVQDEGFMDDPVGLTKMGADFGYGKTSIACIEHVMMEEADRILDNSDPSSPGFENEAPVRQATGLFVIAVQDYETVLSDVRSLGTQLGKLLLFATLMLLAVATGMWFFVSRLMRESREKLARAFSPTDGSAFQEMETIAAIDRSKTTDVNA